MRLPKDRTPIPYIIAGMLAVIMTAGCGDNSLGTLPPPDFSTVPEPFDTTQAVSKETRDNGLIIYTIEEGDGLFKVVESSREAIEAYYTGRTYDGEVFASSYANGSMVPARFSNLTSMKLGQTGPLIEGFRLGLFGMIEGEKRTIVIPPSLGYGSSRRGTNGYDLRNDTLVYDVELAEILD